MGLYEGKLNKRISKREIIERAESAGSVDAALRRIYLERLQLLFEHFGIDPATKGSSTELLWALAESHVPGFRITKAGRPKTVRRPSLHAVAGLQPPPKKGGRPPKYSDDEDWALLQTVEEKKLEMGKGTTDKAALEALLSQAIDDADKVLSRTRSAHRRRTWIDREVRREQKRLSQARKKFQKPARNSHS